MKYKVGDEVVTCNGHKGTITKIYKIFTGVLYCEIRSGMKELYVCPLSYIMSKQSEVKVYAKSGKN